MSNNKEMLKAVGGCVLLWVSFMLLQYASNLWLENSGFGWGCLVVVLVCIQHSIYGYSGTLVFGDIEKAVEYVKTDLGLARWAVDVYCVLLCYFGWKFACIGWCHWWTGVIASLALGTYLLVGVMLMLLGLIAGGACIATGIKRA